MTRIEKKACAFLLAFLMSASLFLPFLQKTAYAEESEEFMVTETQEDALPGEAISENEPEVQDVQDEGEKLTETALSSEGQLEPLTMSGEQEEEREQEEQGVKEQALEEQEDGETSEPSGEETDVPEEQSGDWKYKVSDEATKTAVITGYTGTASEIQIPGTLTVSVNGTEITYTVVEIGERAFEENVSLINAEIPNTVTTLQYGAFCGCTSLKSVSFENGSALETIGSTTFLGATSLEGIQCPANLKTIGEYAFYLDSSLVRAELNEGLTEIGRSAFSYTGLESIKIPDTIKSISENVFAQCESLAVVTLGKNVEEIGISAFSGCTLLTEISLPASLRSIDEYAFSYTGLKQIDIPDSVTSIGDGVFAGCMALKDVKIGNGLAAISDFAFTASGVETIDFGNKVKTIGDRAFSNNQSLTKLVLPSNVTDLQYASFVRCTNLISITLPDTIEHLYGENFGETAWYENQPEGEVYLGKAFYYYKGQMPENTKLEIKEGTRCIAGYSCSDQANLTEVSLPEGLISIGHAAFFNTGLKSIQIPSSVTQIDQGAVGYLRGGDVQMEYNIGYGQPDSEFVIFGYPGTAAESYAKENGIQFTALDWDVSMCNISGIATSYAYTGAAIRPEITVKKNETVVSPDEYEVSYKDNIQAGTASVTITGKGSLKGSVTKTFTITALPVTQCKIEGIAASYEFTGKEIKPAVTLKAGSVTIPSANYTVSYKNNQKAGKATVTISGKGSLSGSVTKNFVIQPKLTLKKTSYSKTTNAESFKLNAKASGSAKLTYTSSNQKVVKVKNGTVSVKGAGKAVITVTASENGASVSKKINVTVKPEKMAAPSLTAKKKSMTVAWKKASGVKGYEIQYSTNKKFKSSASNIAKVKKVSTKKTTIRGLKSKTYYVRIRAYGADSQKGSWSKAVKVKVK